MIENDALIRVDEKKGLNILTENKPKRSSNLGEYVKKGGPGRPVGSRNKIPGDLRADLMTVFERLGGVEGMVAWANESNANKGQFYKMLTSIIPKQLEAELRHHNDLNHYINDLSLLSDEELNRIIQRGNARMLRRGVSLLPPGATDVSGYLPESGSDS